MERNSKGQFNKGIKPHNKKTKEELEVSRKRWKEITKKWHKDNKDRINEQRRLKRLSNPSFKISCNLRKRLSFLLRKHSISKSKQTFALLGCSMNFFLEYMSSKFSEGMSFENYGQWHIDHIQPCNSFNLDDIEQQKICFHYSNLQPLWAIDNRRKSDKII